MTRMFTVMPDELRTIYRVILENLGYTPAPCQTVNGKPTITVIDGDDDISRAVEHLKVATPICYDFTYSVGDKFTISYDEIGPRGGIHTIIVCVVKFRY